MPRTGARWDALTAPYRRRLEHAGITREAYLSGASLQTARGQSKERVHARQRYLIATYGPRDRYALPLITPSLLRQARKEKGEEWVTGRLEQMGRDYKQRAAGHRVYPGDPEYSRKVDAQAYQAGNNPYAPFYMYGGIFG